MSAKPTPKWKKQVDHTLWAFARLRYAIAYHEALIDVLEKESQTPQAVAQLDIIHSRKESLLKMETQISRVLDFLFPSGTEKRRFVEAYWLTVSSREARPRTLAVIQELPFLGADPDHSPEKGNRNFYHWRTSIYQELAEGFGFYPESFVHTIR